MRLDIKSEISTEAPARTPATVGEPAASPVPAGSGLSLPGSWPSVPPDAVFHGPGAQAAFPVRPSLRRIPEASQVSMVTASWGAGPGLRQCPLPQPAASGRLTWVALAAKFPHPSSLSGHSQAWGSAWQDSQQRGAVWATGPHVAGFPSLGCGHSGPGCRAGSTPSSVDRSHWLAPSPGFSRALTVHGRAQHSSPVPQHRRPQEQAWTPAAPKATSDPRATGQGTGRESRWQDSSLRHTRGLTRHWAAQVQLGEQLPGERPRVPWPSPEDVVPGPRPLLPVHLPLARSQPVGCSPVARRDREEVTRKHRGQEHQLACSRLLCSL